MKLYKPRGIKKRIEYRSALTNPDRDAVIWTVDSAGHYAFVKIQGSSETIKAHFPRNWLYIPTWVKPGNAVRIRHRQGNRGYIEIIGEGRAIPTALSGENLPTPIDYDDAVLSGLNILPATPPRLAVSVTSGTYRINGVNYTYDAESNTSYVMDDPTMMYMDWNPGVTMGDGEYVVEIADTSTMGATFVCGGNDARLDYLVIGTDGIIDYHEGTPVEPESAEDEPTISVPNDHVLIGTIFIIGAVERITEKEIGARWVDPEPFEIVFYANTPGDKCAHTCYYLEFYPLASENIPKGPGKCYWATDCNRDDSTPPMVTITLFLRNQYGRCMEDYAIDVNFVSGAGILSDDYQVVFGGGEVQAGSTHRTADVERTTLFYKLWHCCKFIWMKSGCTCDLRDHGGNPQRNGPPVLRFDLVGTTKVSRLVYYETPGLYTSTTTTTTTL